MIEVPEPADVPPQLPVYHCQPEALLRFPLAMASIVLPPLHIELYVAEMVGVVGGVHSTSYEPMLGVALRVLPHISIVGAPVVVPA